MQPAPSVYCMISGAVPCRCEGGMACCSECDGVERRWQMAEMSADVGVVGTAETLILGTGSLSSTNHLA